MLIRVLTLSVIPASATPFILTPGSEPGKIGGITFLLDSYQIGPHSDGDYWIALPQSAFRTLLADRLPGLPAAPIYTDLDF